MSEPNFIGFQPAEFEEGMKTLGNVIKLRAQLKEEVEKSRGFESNLVKENERRAKPINDEIAKQNSLMLTYSSAKDIAEAKFQANESKKLKDAADARAAQTNDLGDAELAAVYGLQLDYAKSKLKYLESVQSLTKAKTPKERADRTKVVDDAITNFQDSLDLFTSANIPAGFVQAVDIRTVPAQPQAQIGMAQQPQIVPGAPQVPVNQPQGQITQPPNASEILLQMYDDQTEPNFINAGKQMYITDMNDKSAKGSVTLSNVAGNDFVYGKVKGSNVIWKTKEGQIRIPSESILNILDNPWFMLDKEDLKNLVRLYIASFQDIAVLTKGKTIPDIDVELESGDAGKNPEFTNVLSELHNEFTKGSGILGDAIKTLAKKTTKTLGLAPKPKRGPPKLRLGPNGEYGNVRVDMPALLNRGRVRVMRGGAIVLDEVEENVDGFGLSRLITKRVMQKTLDAAPPKVRKQYERLNKLANNATSTIKQAPKPSTKGSGMMKKPQIVVVGDDKDLAQRLKIAVGEYGAGNDSSENIQLITELAKKMMDLGKISSDRYRQIVESIA